MTADVMTELRYSTHAVEEDDIASVVRVMRSPWLTQGPTIEAFEAALCVYTGARYAVVCSSGTAALHLAYAALANSLGSETVLTSPLTFVATANTALMAGHEVAFRDVEHSTGNMAAPARRARVIVPVHYAGRPCNLRPLVGATVIEDACHAIGAVDFDGCGRIGNCAHSLATVFSFHAVKPITTGEGGAVMTNDEGFAQEMRLLRSHGRDERGRMVALGFNYRLTDMQAAMGVEQLERIDEMRERRLRWVDYYREKLPQSPGLTLPPPNERSSWHLFPVRIKNNRNDVKSRLNSAGIWAQIHYPTVHLQPYYRDRFNYREGMFPEAEAWAAEELSLPLHASMNKSDADRVIEALRATL